MEKVELTGVPETMLQTLHARAQYALSHPQLLSDPQAVELVSRIDYDFTAARTDRFMSFGTAARTLLFDDLVHDFITRHPGCTVVNIACGLDTRFHRVDDGKVHWYDLDLPQVIDIRRQLIAPVDRVRMISASAMDPRWPEEVEVAGEVLVIVEGLTMYLSADDLRVLMGIIHDFFPGATALVEVMAPLFRRFGREKSVVKSGARFTYGCRNGKKFCRTVAPGFRAERDVRLSEGMKRIQPRSWLITWTPMFRMIEERILVLTARPAANG
ncbi:class I SAM-dependent methyltransferase [[Pseudopropionibacterium] massiliense]|uniref:class I SAM-dependent methyltransferase n=1 Tax=[Pseudopropionibacterium] massiliense TaxID=2220000 RepID=UPI0010326C9A|nr:class I SAM-dependent methyltransferase [[Pseudopropionibacterium] massiliense]